MTSAELPGMGANIEPGMYGAALASPAGENRVAEALASNVGQVCKLRDICPGIIGVVSSETGDKVALVCPRRTTNDCQVHSSSAMSLVRTAAREISERGKSSAELRRLAS